MWNRKYTRLIKTFSCKGIQKSFAFLTILISTIILTGCGFGELKTDVGIKSVQEVDPTQYLDMNALSKVQEGDAETEKYTLYTLGKGTYTKPVLAIQLYRAMVSFTPVISKVQGTTMKLVDYPVTTFDYVEEGEVLANVIVEGDTIAISAMKKQRDRLVERFADAAEKNDSDRQNKLIAYLYPADIYAKSINTLELEQFDRTWQYTKANFEKQIKALEEEIQKETDNINSTSIKAPIAGVCIFDKKLNAGDSIENHTLICNIVPYEPIYMTGENKDNFFQYGMNLDYKVANYDLPEGTTGKIIGGTSNLLYGNLDTSDIIVQLAVDAGKVPKLMSVQGTGDIDQIENCVLVPNSAVTVKETRYYVTLYKEDGTTLKSEFIPGGTNGTFYWVLSGLNEGMVVLIDK